MRYSSGRSRGEAGKLRLHMGLELAQSRQFQGIGDETALGAAQEIVEALQALQEAKDAVGHWIRFPIETIAFDRMRRA